jgi:hypothetical protein
MALYIRTITRWGNRAFSRLAADQEGPVIGIKKHIIRKAAFQLALLKIVTKLEKIGNDLLILVCKSINE